MIDALKYILEEEDSLYDYNTIVFLEAVPGPYKEVVDAKLRQIGLNNYYIRLGFAEKAGTGNEFVSTIGNILAGTDYVIPNQEAGDNDNDSEEEIVYSDSEDGSEEEK